MSLGHVWTVAPSLQQSGEGPRKRASTGTEMGGRERGSSESSTRSERSDTVSQGDDTTSQKSDPSPLVSSKDIFKS